MVKPGTPGRSRGARPLAFVKMRELPYAEALAVQHPRLDEHWLGRCCQQMGMDLVMDRCGNE